MRPWWIGALAAFIGMASLGADCDETEVKVTGNPDAGTGVLTNPTYGYQQSETAISTNTVSSSTVVTVAFNDETQSTVQLPKIVYTETTRTVYSGASLMGWAYSENKGSSWTYGGRLSPPSGWAVLWGDPSITNLPSDQSRVFMANLAVPNSMYPVGGIVGDLYPYLGGACIAKSVDSGRNFSIHQCVTNQNHFYDGSSMAAGPSGIYAAFIDLDADPTSRIDVWRAPDQNSAFYRLADPFPPPWVPAGHPRLRFANGMLWAAAQMSNGQVMINRYICVYGACGWQAPVIASEAGELSPDVPLEGGQVLRTGPQFSFDVGTGTDDQSVRIMVTRMDPTTGRLYVKGSICPPGLMPGCSAVEAWSSLAGGSGHQFNPLIKAATKATGETVFVVSYNSVNDGIAQGNNIQSVQVRLTGTWPNGIFDYVVSGKIPAHPVCPDDRGYWGDYDDLQFLDRTAAGTPRFIRAYSDSTNGCQYQWEYTSKHLHVSSAIVE